MKPAWGSLRWLAVGVAALALSACAGAVPSGNLSVENVEFNPSTSNVEFMGLVEAIASDAWTVGGVPVGVTADTEIDSGLSIGDLANVHALVASGNILTAQEIRAVEGDTASPSSETSQVEFTGAAVSIDTASWVIGDQTIALDAATEIKDAIVVGDMVKVHAMVLADGSLLGTEIGLANDGVQEAGVILGELDFFGAVEDMQADLWTVGGTTFKVSPETEIKDAIVLGDLVRVAAVQNPDGSYLAHEIELQEPLSGNQTQGDPTEFSGTVTAMDASRWTVGGLTFLITPSTEIKDAIVLGDFVKVEASVATDGTRTALEIQLDDEQQIGDDQESEDDHSGGDDQQDEQDSEDDSGHGGSGGSDGGDD